MELTKKKLDELMKQAKKMLSDMGYDIPKYSHGFSTSEVKMGTCYYGKKKIVISPHVLKYHTEEKALDTCIHELLHAIAHEKYACKGHTGEWKQLARAVNKRYNMSIQRCYRATKEQAQAEIAKYKYFIFCENCGFIGGRKKKSVVIKNPTKYHCGKCGGELRIKESID